MLSFFPRGVLDEILNLIESVSEDFPSYFYKVSLTKFLFKYIYVISCLKNNDISCMVITEKVFKE